MRIRNFSSIVSFFLMVFLLPVGGYAETPKKRTVTKTAKIQQQHNKTEKEITPLLIPYIFDIKLTKTNENFINSKSLRPAHSIIQRGEYFAISQDGRVSASYNRDYDNLYKYETITISGTHNKSMQIAGSGGSNHDFALSADGTMLAIKVTENSKDFWSLYDLPNERLIMKFDFYAVHVAFTPDSKYLSNGYHLIDLVHGNKEVKFNEHCEGYVTSLSFSPDGHVLFIGRNGSNEIAVYNVATGKLIERLNTASEINFLSFLNDGKTLVSSSNIYRPEIRFYNTWEYSSKKLFASENSQIQEHKKKYTDFLKNTSNLENRLILEKQQVLQNRVTQMRLPRNEFEKTSEYNDRIQKAEQIEKQIDAEYSQKRKEALAQVAQEKAEWKRLLTNSLYTVKIEAALGNYDPDKESFSVTLADNTITIPVPRHKAVELSKNKDKVFVEGKVRYYNQTHAELVNAYLSEDTTGYRIAFGNHLEPIMVASTEKTPPQLTISSLSIIEPSGNGILDAGEKGKIRAVVKNGAIKGTAFGVNATFEPSTLLPAGITIEAQKYIGAINAGDEKIVEADISATDDISAADIQIKASATESNGFDAKPVVISFKSKALVPPVLQIASVDIKSSDGKRVLSKGVQADLVVHVQNAGNGVARNVSVVLNTNSRDIVACGSDSIKIGTLAPGESKEVTFSLAVNQRYQGGVTLPVTFAVKEERPRFSVKPDIKLALNEEISEIRTVKVEARENLPAQRVSAIDDLSPPTLRTDELLFGNNDHAVIIGIERYRNNLPKADFAYDDAKLVKAYFKELGIPERNIDYLTDDKASFNDLKIALETRLKNRVRSNSRVIVYYSGHGAPEPSTGQAFLVPYDGNPSYLPDTGYPLKRLYDNLAELNARETMVLLDACFSGIGGRSVLASGARALVRIDKSTPNFENMLIFSSTQGSQISTSFPEKKHGLFTYFFLKAIKDGKKDMASVYDSVKPLVEDESKRQNVEQSPTVTPSPDKIRGRFTLRK